MKKIECRVLNDPARRMLLIFSTTLSLFTFMILFSGFSDKSLPNIYRIIILLTPILIYGLSWFLFRLKVTYLISNGKPKIIIKGLISKKIFEWPFDYDIGINDYPIVGFASVSYFMFELIEGNYSIRLHDPVACCYADESIPIEDDVPRFLFFGILRTVDSDVGKIYKIFKTLEKDLGYQESYNTNPQTDKI